MKKTIIMATILLLTMAVLFSAGEFEDTDYNWDKDRYISITVDGEVDSVETVKSNVIRLDKYRDLNSIVKPILAHYEATAQDTSSDSIKVSLYLYGSYDNSDYFVWDTLATISTTNTQSITEVELDLNDKWYPYAKIYATGNSNNRQNISVKVILNYFMKKYKW